MARLSGPRSGIGAPANVADMGSPSRAEGGVLSAVSGLRSLEDGGETLLLWPLTLAPLRWLSLLGGLLSFICPSTSPPGNCNCQASLRGTSGGLEGIARGGAARLDECMELGRGSLVSLLRLRCHVSKRSCRYGGLQTWSPLPPAQPRRVKQSADATRRGIFSACSRFALLKHVSTLRLPSKPAADLPHHSPSSSIRRSRSLYARPAAPRRFREGA